jgi:nitric oxide reductase
MSQLRSRIKNMSLPKPPFVHPLTTEPAAEYARLRATNPVSQFELFGGSIAWLVVGFKDIQSVLTDDRLSKVRPASAEEKEFLALSKY